MPERVEVWSIDLDETAERLGVLGGPGGALPGRIAAPSRSLDRLGPLPAPLDARERARARAIVDPLAGARFAAAHAALREILAARAGEAPGALRFVAGNHGKPALASHPELPFNLSHAGGWALVAVAESAPVGVDIERPRERLDARRLAERFFTAREARAVAERPEAFLEIWTRREALAKALGTGLSGDPATYEVGVAGDREAAHHIVAGGRTWSLRTVSAPEPYVAALAAGAAELEVVERRYSPR